MQVIDVVFTKFLDKFESFICYFSYHKPIVSFLKSDDTENDNEKNIQHYSIISNNDRSVIDEIIDD